VGAAVGCAKKPTGSGNNLLADLRPTRAQGVVRPDVLTDGVVAVEGDDWLTDLSARFASSAAFVEYDLKESRTVSAALLQGDNNDDYVISISEDGQTFSPLWSAPSLSSGGQRVRHAAGVFGRGRYVRMAPGQGDGQFSVTEVQLFPDIPSAFPPSLRARHGAPLNEVARGAILLFAATLVAFLFSTSRACHRMLSWAAGAMVVLTAIQLARALSSAWPLGSLDVSLVRATAAATAATAILAVRVAPRLRPTSRATVGVLGLCAAASVASFFNLGRPQFVDHTTGRPSVVHNFDMRVYFPIAKYFEELRFDGLYLASVAAYADDGAGASMSSLGETQVRNLKTHHMERVRDVEAHVRSVQQRFSPERWVTFRQDMRYFRQTMGVDDYLGSLTDHGGNATPVWFSEARLLFSRAGACNGTLLAAALLDPLLLLAMFAAIGRSFGIKTMLVSMVVFGANDFYMFGTNWAGATLRHDWLALLGLGICALKVERWALGGALLAFAAMIRAFPALALAGCIVPFGWSIWESRHAGGRWRPHLGQEYRHGVRIALGAALCAVALALASSLILSPSAWMDWLHKVSLLDRNGSTNEISLRALLAGNGNDRDAILSALGPIRVVAIGVAITSVVVAMRRRAPHQAALLGLLLVPVLFNPSNYYLHFICLLPLIVDERDTRASAAQPSISPRDAATWFALLGLCAAQYWTVLERDVGLHFRFATVLYFATAAFLVFNALRQNAEPRTEQPA